MAPRRNNEATVDIPFGGGIDQKTHPNLLTAPFILNSENMRSSKTGSLEKRNGFETVPVTGLPTYTAAAPPVTLSNIQHPVLIAADNSYNFRDDVDRWVRLNASAPIPTDVRATPQLRGERPVGDVDSAVNQGFVCYAWDESYSTDPANRTSWISLKRLDSDVTVIHPTQFTNFGVYPRVIAFGNFFVIIVHDNTTNDLRAVSIDISVAVPVFSARVVLAAGTNDQFDAFGLPAKTFGNVMYRDNATNDTIAIRINGVPAVTATTGPLIGAYQTVNALAIYHNDILDNIWCAVNNASTGVSAIHTFNINELYTVVSATTFAYNTLTVGADAITLTERDDTGAMLVAHCGDLVYAPTGTKYTQWQNLTIARAPVGGNGVYRNLRLATKAFRPPGHGAMLGVYPFYGTSLQANPALLTHKHPVNLVVTPYTLQLSGDPAPNPVESLRPVARFSQDEIRNQQYAIQYLPSVTPIAPGSSQWLTCGNVLSRFIRGVSPSFSFGLTGNGINQDIFTYAPEAQRAQVLNSTINYSGGIHSTYDNQIIFENTPHTSPRKPENFNRIVGLSGPPEGSIYKFVYVYTDNEGNIRRSAPSPVSALAPAAGGVPLEMNVNSRPPSGVDGQFGDFIRMEIYRSDPIGPAAASEVLMYLHETITLGDPHTQAFIIYTDSQNTVSTSGELIYTAGNVFENDPPPAFLDVIIANNRVWGVSSEQQNSVWYSKINQLGLGQEFNANLTVSLPNSDAQIVALSAMDEKVILFTQGEIYVVLGEGPTDSGGGAPLVGPRLVSSDVGCIQKNSVIEGPFGIIFLSAKGFYLLDRGLNSVFIGAQIEDETRSILSPGTDTQKLITSAALVENQNQARFTVAAEVPTIFVYDYYHQQWFVYTFLAGNSLRHSIVLKDGRHELLGLNQISVENDDIFTDRGVRIQTIVRTSWIKLAGVKGFQRIKRAAFLINRASGSVLINAYVDYDDGTVESYFWTEAAAALVDPPNNYEVHLARQKCESVSFEIVEAGVPIVNGAGQTISGLTLLYGIKQGVMKNNEQGGR